MPPCIVVSCSGGRVYLVVGRSRRFGLVAISWGPSLGPARGGVSDLTMMCAHDCGRRFAAGTICPSMSSNCWSWSQGRRCSSRSRACSLVSRGTLPQCRGIIFPPYTGSRNAGGARKLGRGQSCACWNVWGVGMVGALTRSMSLEAITPSLRTAVHGGESEAFEDILSAFRADVAWRRQV